MNTADENTQAPDSIGDFLADIRREWIKAGVITEEAANQPPRPREPKTPEEMRQIARKSRLARFCELCPAEFRSPIDRARIPNLAAWDQADAWTGTHPGAWIWSKETGKAKTRMLWRQFGRLHVDQNRNVFKISGQALGEEYFRYHMDGNPRAFYRWVTSYDVVMIDDIDKIDIDDRRAPRMLRELFDHLYERRHPCLVTANEPIAHFAKRIGESTARRMNEVCSEILF